MPGEPTLVFGNRTAILLLLALQALVVAGLLLTARRNRSANRFLAALLGALALSLGTDIIGFAGFYDRWPWLTFAPFDIALLPGPLLYLFVVSLTRGAAPTSWRSHLLAPAAEGTYRTVCFLLPFPLKMSWSDGGHEAFVGPLIASAGFVSLVGYTLLAGRNLVRYRRWLADHVSFGEDFQLPWLRLYLATMTLLVIGVVAFTLTNPGAERDQYFHWFWFHLGVAIAGFAMGVAALRAAEWSYPVMTSAPGPAAPRGGGEHTVVESQSGVGAPATDATTTLAELARAWDVRLREEQWFRDPQLTLARLADRLGVAEGQLSRGLNQGLDLNFNEFVNRARVEAVQVALADPAETRDLLPIAFDAGFTSKASFNRAFKAATGETPTAFRARSRVSTSAQG